MYISNFPVPFHDIIEIMEFLESLPPTILMMFDGLPVGYPGCSPLLYIRVYYYDEKYYISYYFSRK